MIKCEHEAPRWAWKASMGRNATTWQFDWKVCCGDKSFPLGVDTQHSALDPLVGRCHFHQSKVKKSAFRMILNYC